MEAFLADLVQSINIGFAGGGSLVERNVFSLFGWDAGGGSSLLRYSWQIGGLLGEKTRFNVIATILIYATFFGFCLPGTQDREGFLISFAVFGAHSVLLLKIIYF